MKWKVNDRTSDMLNTPPQDRLYKHLYVFNACEQSCVAMIMVCSKMSKTEDDLKAIMYRAYDTPINCAIYKGINRKGLYKMRVLKYCVDNKALFETY